MPVPDTVEEAEKGKVMLGGCCVTDDDPDWHCKECEYEWSKAQSQLSKSRT